jgi:hypothetical protein
MGSGGGRGELSRHYEGGAISAPGFTSSRIIQAGAEDGTLAVDAVVEDRLQALEPPLAEKLALGDLKTLVQNKLAEELDVERVNVIGSSAKGTQIGRVAGNDVDLEVVLKRESLGDWLTQENGPRNCLTKVRSLIEGDPRFSSVEAHVDRNVVSARVGSAKVDIVPAFIHPEGGVLIPDTSGGQTWIRTNPRLSKRLLQIQDDRHRSQVVPMVKLAKDWSLRNGDYLDSYMVEATVMRYFAEKPKDGEDSYRANFHEYISRLPLYFQKGAARDPVYGGPLDDDLDSAVRSRLISKAIRDTKKLQKAERLLKAGNSDRGADLYREVLGG